MTLENVSSNSEMCDCYGLSFMAETIYCNIKIKMLTKHLLYSENEGALIPVKFPGKVV